MRQDVKKAPSSTAVWLKHQLYPSLPNGVPVSSSMSDPVCCAGGDLCYFLSREFPIYIWSNVFIHLISTLANRWHQNKYIQYKFEACVLKVRLFLSWHMFPQIEATVLLKIRSFNLKKLAKLQANFNVSKHMARN